MTAKMRFELILQWKQQNPSWPLKVLCRVLGVSRSGYALFSKRHKSQARVQPHPYHTSDAALLLHIRAAYRRGRFYSGSPRVYDDLRDHGIRTSRKRVARLMKQNGLVGRSRARRRVVTTDSGHRLPVAANLLARRFTPEEVGRPNRFWCGDITYLPTQEGWLYLAMVKDLFSRRIVGWALGETLEATLVETAWQRALQTRGFAPHQGPELYHSDRGSQYASRPFRNLLAASNTQASMSGTGECLDNAVAEKGLAHSKPSFWATNPADASPAKGRRGNWLAITSTTSTTWCGAIQPWDIKALSPSKWRNAPNNEPPLSPCPLCRGTFT